MIADSIHLIIPMSGQGTRFKSAGYNLPKPLITAGDQPIIENLLDSYPESWPTTFVLPSNHQDTSLPSILMKKRPKATMIFIPPHTEGPGHAIDAVLNQIPDNTPVLVSYCDFGMRWDAAKFENFVKETGCDACLICYKGFHPHYLRPTKYAYAKIDDSMKVLEVREKENFTDDRQKEPASAGAYYFRSSRLLREALAFQKKHNITLNNELYTSLTVQSLILMNPGADIRIFEIPFFFQWGTPDDLQDYNYWHQTFKRQKEQRKFECQVDQILMPMAGEGSRLSSLKRIPKPFLDIRGTPMFLRALKSLPKAKTKAFVTLREHYSEFSDLFEQDFKIKQLDTTPKGQALSTYEGLELIDLNKEVLVSACDHEVVICPTQWQKLRSTKSVDAAIFTVRNYPGVDRSPKAFAYVETAPDQNEGFALIQRISVKQPISDRPREDRLLVGTFWFSKGRLLMAGIESLIEHNIRVNGELYLDSIFALMLKKGVKVVDFPLDGYINWGDPDALNEAMYWLNAFDV